MLPDNDLTWKIIGAIALISMIYLAGMAFDIGRALLSVPHRESPDIFSRLRNAQGSYASQSPTPETPPLEVPHYR